MKSKHEFIAKIITAILILVNAVFISIIIMRFVNYGNSFGKIIFSKASKETAETEVVETEVTEMMKESEQTKVSQLAVKEEVKEKEENSYEEKEKSEIVDDFNEDSEEIDDSDEENSDEENSDEENTDKEDDSIKHNYSFLTADITWKEAYEESVNSGGYLVNIDSDEEAAYIFNALRELDMTGYTFYIGGKREKGRYEYHWVDADGEMSEETINGNSKYDQYWLDGEPSFKDETDKDEKYLDLIYRKSDDRWYFNDIRSDIITDYSYNAGKIGYIVEYE